MDSSQILTCGGLDCSVCSALQTVSGIFRYLLSISAALAILLVVTAGFLYIFAHGQEKKLRQTKRFLFYAVFGFAVALLSFLIIYTTFYFSGSNNREGWYNFQCNVDEDPNVSGGDKEDLDLKNTSYLETGEGQIIESGSLAQIVSGDSRIVRLRPEEMDAGSMAADISLLDPDKTITFVAADKEVGGDGVINFRNVELGFDPNSLLKTEGTQYQFQKREEAGDTVIDPRGKIKSLLSIGTSDAEGQYFGEAGGDLEKYLGQSFNVDKEGLEKIITALKVTAQMAGLNEKYLYAYVSGSPVVKGTRDENCYDTGGEITDFSNICFADKERYENRNLKCSNLNKPVTGCDCPGGYYLVGEKCVNAREIKENKANQNKNRNENINGNGNANRNKNENKNAFQNVSPAGTCQGRSLEEHQCPPSRCEGDKMIYYPTSVKDECFKNLNGEAINRKSCIGQTSPDATENQRCQDFLDRMSKEEIMKQAEDFYNKNKTSSDWYDKILEKEFGKGSDVQSDSSKGSGNSGSGSGGSGTGKGGNNGSGKDSSSDTSTVDDTGTGDDTGKGRDKDTGKSQDDTGPLPGDQGAGNFNPTPSFQELKECIGLKGDQIPYNGILVVLLHPNNFDRSDTKLINNDYENISRMFYLSRNGEVIGKNGVDIGKNPTLGGQEYGARDFSKGASNRSMWGRGWKIFKGPTTYNKGGWVDSCSYGSHDGYKIGDYTRNDQNNLGGGKILSMGRCGQHIGKKGSSAGCATMGNKSRCGFINKSKEYMTKSNGTIMQINFKGEMSTLNGKFSSPDCGKINYCAAKKSFQNNSGSSKFKNDPNDGYDASDKRRVEC